MFFADKNFWDFATEQTATVVVTAIFVYAGFHLAKWLVVRYVDPIGHKLDRNGTLLEANNQAQVENGKVLEKIAASGENIEKSNAAIQEALADSPSDLPGKIARACPLKWLTREEFSAIIKELRNDSRDDS